MRSSEVQLYFDHFKAIDQLDSFLAYLEYKEYCEKKAAGTYGKTQLKPLSEMFTEDEL